MPSEICIAFVAVLHAVLAAVADWQAAAICLAISSIFALVAWLFGALSTRPEAEAAPAQPLALVPASDSRNRSAR